MPAMPTTQTLATLLRESVCSRCNRSPATEKNLPPVIPRTCEGNCPLFNRLPLLAMYAENLDPMVDCHRGVVRILSNQVTDGRRSKHQTQDTGADTPKGGNVFREFESEIAEAIQEAGHRRRLRFDHRIPPHASECKRTA
jgi:hypothetical protein